MIYVIFTFAEIVQTLEKGVIPFPPEWDREGEDCQWTMNVELYLNEGNVFTVWRLPLIKSYAQDLT